MALTNLGYERPTYDEIVEQQEERARLLFGNDIDTSHTTALGKFIRLNAKDYDEIYQDNERIYNSRSPHTATGVSLDRACVFAGISRNPATYAQHSVRFTGIAGEYVPEAFEVSTADGTLSFHTYQRYLIGEDGTVEGVVECETAGVAGNVAVGKIDTIVNPDANVESVQHLGIALYGEEVEDDVSFRARFDATKSSSGAGTTEAIRSGIMQVALVEGVAIVENDTEETVDGVPPHSFECYVLCPDSQNEQVATAIFKKKPLGIKAVGDLSIDVIDDNGITHTVGFTKTAEVPIYIKLTIAVNKYFGADGVEQIKKYVAEYINSLKNDADVYLSSIYGYVYKVGGIVNVSSLTMSKDGGSYSTGDISIGIAEVARVNTANIEVVVA